MDDKIKNTFDQIHADEYLKSETKKYLIEKTDGYSTLRRCSGRMVYAIAAGIAAVFLMAGGGISYFTPVAAISIDINPSIELQINPYDRVIDCTGYNDDGTRVVQQLDVRHMNYADAVDLVLENEEIEDYLEEDNLLEVTVAGDSEKRTDRIHSCISRKHHVDAEHVHNFGDNSDIEAAHSSGLSIGKYRMYCRMREADPDVTVEHVHSHSMRELNDEMECKERCREDSYDNDLQEYQDDNTDEYPAECPAQQYGCGRHHRHGCAQD